MTLYLADTTFHVDVERKQDHALWFLDRVRRDGDELATCLVVVTEYYSGRLPGNRPDMDSLIEGLRYLEMDRAIAMGAAEYRFRFARRGIQLRIPDALIAALARAVGAVVVTENLRDFPMPDVQVVSTAALMREETAQRGRDEPRR